MAVNASSLYGPSASAEIVSTAIQVMLDHRRVEIIAQMVSDIANGGADLLRCYCCLCKERQTQRDCKASSSDAHSNMSIVFDIAERNVKHDIAGRLTMLNGSNGIR